jgi:S-(hydroxymethyl)glutathione dehydrogenase/alcohol dehydrogenase
VIWTAGVEPGANVAVFGLGGIGLNVIQGARLRAPTDRRHRHQPGQARHGRAVRHDPLHQPGRSRARQGRAGGGRRDDGGADYSFDCTGNTDVMRQALECCHRGWGKSVVIGVAESGREIATRPVPARHRAASGPARLSAARAGRTDVPRIVDWYMDGKIAIDPLITHTMRLDDINQAFDLMHAGESIRSVVIY